MSIQPKIQAYRNDVVRRRFATEPTSAIAKDLGIDPCTVVRYAHRLGLHLVFGGQKRRAEHSKSCDVRYFDHWSADMAYILGFMWADGSIDAAGYMISVWISKLDESVIRFIKDKMKVTSEPRQYPPSGKRGPTVNLRISSRLIIKRLSELGMFPSKTFRNDPFPNVPDDYLGHFIRGFLDGDGSVSTCRSRAIRFIGPVLFIQGLTSKLVNQFGMIRSKITVTKGKRATWANVTWTNPNSLRLFYRNVYPEGFGFCLERKRKPLYEWLMASRVEMDITNNNAESLGFTKPLSMHQWRNS